MVAVRRKLPQLNSVEDLRGFKIRVPVTALLTSLFSGLGALTSSISYSELYFRCLQAELAGKGMTFNKPDPVQFRAALVKASFCTQWQKTCGAETLARLEQYAGWLT
jgi:Bacterial extracellular solute-binding protein, family 7